MPRSPALFSEDDTARYAFDMAEVDGAVPIMTQAYMFVVDTAPFCVWGSGLNAIHESFLKSFDRDYFAFVSSTLHAAGESEHKQRAALAIKSTYGHALETFFSLVGAAIQSPDCVPIWLLKYRNEQLRSLVRKISAGERVLSRLRCSPMTWEKRGGKQDHQQRGCAK